MNLRRQETAPSPAARPMDPRDRLRLYGPIRPMQPAPSLIERILFS
ncbi:MULTISPECIES: hypothetical protein [unclassified Novosphingobium]|nr:MULTISPECIES: hypothetical protein [unclassified Novosphingobium]MBN9143874.1 hypothetical protein [Novosphingobium sp.]MDR6707059.1 hypothetical protein [Novosphingobium sp. 1748]NKJ02157.1 hypothetical protein [Novosphingobium sp. SG707]